MAVTTDLIHTVHFDDGGLSNMAAFINKTKWQVMKQPISEQPQQLDFAAACGGGEHRTKAVVRLTATRPGPQQQPAGRQMTAAHAQEQRRLAVLIPTHFACK